MSTPYPPVGFHFKVVLSATLGLSDTSFQEVSGITAEVETEPYVEGGENRYVHSLPKAVKHPNLVLKRGIAGATSALVLWCRSVFEGDLLAPIVPMPLVVMLLDERGLPERSWSFANAYPVRWDVDPFHAMKNEVAIETIELSYTYSNRLV